MFQHQNVDDSIERRMAELKETLNNGKAVKKFQEMIINQGVESNKAKALCASEADVWKILRKSEFSQIKSNQSGIDIYLFIFFR